MGLKVGDKIPNFSAKDTNGNDFDSTTVLGKKPLVIYFYPKDNTPGCTAQACGFRDQYEDFKDFGADVIGISSDSSASHQRFSERYKLPFTLLSDSNNKIRNAFGLSTGFLGLFSARITYVTDKEGTIIMIFDSMLASKHIPKALEAIKRLVL